MVWTPAGTHSGISFFKEVARGGERTRVLSTLFIFSFYTTLPLGHSSSGGISFLQQKVAFEIEKTGHKKIFLILNLF
jgi:hypothetical protein